MTPQNAKKLLTISLISCLANPFAWAQGNSLKPPSIQLSDLARSPVMLLPSLGSESLPSSAEATALSLPELVRQGLLLSPQRQQTQAQYEAAKFANKAAGAELLPSFSMRFASGPEQSRAVGQDEDNHRQQVSTVRLTQPLYNASLRHEWRSSNETESAARLRLQSATDNVVLSVVRATIDLSAARLVLDFSNVQLAQLQNILDYLETRAQAGASSASDLERAKSRVYSARQTRLEQQAAYRNAFNELRRLTQQSPQSIRLPEMADFPRIEIEQAALKELVLARNPDILAAQRDILSQQAKLDAQWSKYKPQIGLSLEYDDSRNVRGVNGPNKDARALIVANWAFSLGGKEWYLAEQAMAELRQKEAKLEDEKQRLLQALDSDTTLFESAAFRVETAQLEQEAAGKVMTAIEAQLSTGRLGSLLDALDASERFFASRQRLVQAIAQNMKAHAQLLARVGQLGDLQP